MNDIELVRSKIYEIRGQKVMLDRDLAMLYGIETKVLKQAVKRNLKRFPSDFMFELTPDEVECLRSQFVTSNGRGGNRYMPFAFTEQGVTMLSSVINSEAAIEININIMRAFVAVRQMLAQPKTDKFAVLEQRIEMLENYIEEVITDVNDVNEDTRMQIELINESLAELQAEKKTLVEIPRCQIGILNTERSNKIK